MGRAAQQLADHFDLTLDGQWVSWFDDECHRIEPAGTMRSKLDAADLCVSAPRQIWPGFMLPDSLPLVGNDYGDWLCVRVTADGRLGELIYWYHGGGDWIPVGDCLGEALLHDAIDQYRTQRSQMLRGAPETVQGSLSEVHRRLGGVHFQSWLVTQLESKVELRRPVAQSILAQILESLDRQQVRPAMQVLYDNGLAKDAVACDLIEMALQSPLEALADHEIAQHLGMSWYPDYARLLFDVEAFPAELREKILAFSNELEAWPAQDWATAGRLAEEVITRRNDLGWAFTVAGWSKQRVADKEAALAIYWAGQFASSFADQSVRLNCHALAERSGKFSIEQLLAESDELVPEQLQEPYFHLFRESHHRSVLNEVHDFWWNKGLGFHRAADYAAAYDSFFRSGWDLGVSRLSDYGRILQALAENATAAGWHARSRVAQAHLACLQKR